MVSDGLEPHTLPADDRFEGGGQVKRVRIRG